MELLLPCCATIHSFLQVGAQWMGCTWASCVEVNRPVWSTLPWQGPKSNWVDKCMNKSLFKDNSLIDCEGHSNDIMRCACSPMPVDLSCCSIHLYPCICAAKIMPSHSLCWIHAALMQQHSHSTFHAAPMQQHSHLSTYAAVLMQLSRIHSFANFMLQLLCCHIYATTLVQQHEHSTIHSVFTQQHSLSSTCAAGLTLQHSLAASLWFIGVWSSKLTKKMILNAMHIAFNQLCCKDSMEKFMSQPWSYLSWKFTMIYSGSHICFVCLWAILMAS